MIQRCASCMGKGHVTYTGSWDDGREEPINSVCPVCYGSGYIVTDCSGDSCSAPPEDNDEG